MRAAFVFGLLFSFLNNAFPHSPNEVSFSIYEKETFILVDTEFPWAIRNSVFMADSLLTSSSTEEEINNSLFSYVQHNFVLKDLNGNPIKLLKLVDTENSSHHENYQFVFEKKEIGEVKNTLLFNFSDNQKNFHLMMLGNDTIEFVLTPKLQTKIIKKRSQSIVLILATGIVLILLLFSIKKKTNN